MKAFRSLEKDLRNILAWVKILHALYKKNDFENNKFPTMDSDDAAIAKGLYFAILALYGRCFTSAQMRKFTFDLKHVPDEHKEFHEELMRARHNFAAHRGEFEAEDCQIALVVKPSRKNLRTGVFSELQQPFFDIELADDKKENKFIALCDALRDVVEKKYEALCNKIDEDFVRVTPFEFWKKANGKKVNIDEYLRKKRKDAQ
jgi:hypothetical protein